VVNVKLIFFCHLFIVNKGQICSFQRLEHGDPWRWATGAVEGALSKAGSPSLMQSKTELQKRVCLPPPGPAPLPERAIPGSLCVRSVMS